MQRASCNNYGRRVIYKEADILSAIYQKQQNSQPPKAYKEFSETDVDEDGTDIGHPEPATAAKAPSRS